MRKIPLTQGHHALVDDDDYEWLSQWKWYFNRVRNKEFGYAVRGKWVDGKRTQILMHRCIMSPENTLQVDHISGDRLDNQRHNLRVVTAQQNHFNQAPSRKGSSPLKGVSWNSSKSKWEAQIRKNGKKVFLGYFIMEEEAAKAYDEAAMKYFGPFARLNFSMLSYYQ